MEEGILNQYRFWCGSSRISAEDREELISIAGDEKEIEDRFYRDMEFGTAGMRGVMSVGRNRMNRYTVMKATAGLAAFLLENAEADKAPEVAVSYDSRKNSELFARLTAGVLAANGIHAYLYESLRPVPVLSFTIRELGTCAGVMITASHNPKQYNGYKVYGPTGGQMEPEDADLVARKILSLGDLPEIACMDLEEAEQKGLLTWLGKDMDDRYMARIASLGLSSDVYKKVDADFRVVYTPIHGSGSMPVQRALREAGVPGVIVVKEQENPDPEFSTVRVPNPEEGDTLAMAIDLAKKVGADLCIGTDPDCDRMGLAVRDKDGSFRLLTGNQIGCLLLHYILSARKKEGKLPANAAAVRSVVSSMLADEICADFGVKMDTVLTGFKFIAGKIADYEQTGENSFIFGFEESFGYLAGAFARDKDAVQASLLTCEMACFYRLKGMTLLDALEELYRKYGYYQEQVRSFSFAGREGMQIMASLMTNLRNNPPSELAGKPVVCVRDYKTGAAVNADGTKSTIDLPRTNMIEVLLEGSERFVMRPSGTEPKVKLYFGVKEKDKEAADARMEKLISACVSYCGL